MFVGRPLCVFLAFCIFGLAHALASVGNKLQPLQTEGAKPPLVVKEKYCFQRQQFVTQLAFSPDGKLLAAQDSAFGAPGTKDGLTIWEMATGAQKTTVLDPKFAIEEVRSGRKIPEMPEKGLFVGFLPDGNYLVLPRPTEGTVQIRDGKKGEVLRDFRQYPSSLGVSKYALSRDGKMLASAKSKDLIRVSGVETGNVVADLKGGHNKGVCAIRFSPCGKFLASSSFDKTVRIWTAQTGELTHKLTLDTMPLDIAYSPDGKWFAVGSGGKAGGVSIYDASTMKRAVSIEVRPENGGLLAFSHAGSLLAVSGGPVVQVWQILDAKK